MKSILISIKPKYVAEILNENKTIEIRKTAPKCDLPIDVYIYCTKDKQGIFKERHGGYTLLNQNKWIKSELSSKVVAKFTLNKVEEIRFDDKEVQRKACLTEDELFDYLFVNEPYHEDMKKGYAWHISNLKIFDRPRELSEFKKNNSTGNCWKCKLFGSGCSTCQLTKAPQSWCYVEVDQ